ncbi:MAG: CIA30 family protein [Treponema sp.]|jgi:hypothetical protein|nr:CIA30 family protein [Treponema sp.]
MTVKVTTNGWANVYCQDTNLVKSATIANGARFKVYGDGKSWRLCVGTSDTGSDNCYHELKFSTKKNKVTEIDVPYTKLRQPSWGKKKPFNKANIDLFQFRRDGYEDGTAESTIKVFDFELY